MCDYSLESYSSRDGQANDRLITSRFGSGTVGFQDKTGNFSGAVCIREGQRLMLANVPQRVQEKYSVGQVEEVTFVKTEPTQTPHRDAVRFSNGRVVSLQLIGPVEAVVLPVTTPMTAGDPEETNEPQPETPKPAEPQQDEQQQSEPTTVA